MSARVVAMTRGTLRAMHQFLVEALNLPTGTSLALSDKVLDIQGLFLETLTAARATAVATLNALRAEHPQLTPTTLTPIAQITALFDSVKSNDLLQIGLVSLNLSEWQRAVDLMESAHHQLALGDGDRAVQTAQQAQQIILDSLTNLQNRLYEAQHKFIVQATTDSLQALGYRTEVSHHDGWTAIWATRGGHGVAVTLSPESHFEMDMLGWDGTQCQSEVQRIIQNLQERGVTFSNGRKILHGRRSGGVLLQAALKVAREQRLPVPEALLRVARRQAAPQRHSRLALAALLQQQLRR
jgi:hypothetical protein